MKKSHSILAVLLLALSAAVFIRCSELSGAPGKSQDVVFDAADAHPLDELDSNEINAVKHILIDEDIFKKGHYFSFIKLQEPPKAEILAYQPGQPYRREALASVFDHTNNIVTEVLIDLKGSRILKQDTIKNADPVGLLSVKADSALLANIMKSDEKWVAALRNRKISIDSVTYKTNAAADMGSAPAGHRERVVGVRYKNKKYGNLLIGGLFAFVDLTDKKILKIVDDGKGLSEQTQINYFKEDSAISTLDKFNKIEVSQPEGATYTIKGHEITWNNWKFRYAISSREGLIIYQASFKDKDTWRPVLYRGSMPEMVVNYGSPDLLMASNNFFDVGVYRLGQSRARPLTPGADVPDNARFLSSVVHNDTGKVELFEKAVGIYEESDGPLWRHNKKSVAATNLALKYFTTIGNYDYGFKWVFKQDGTIDVVTELNGIVQIRPALRSSDTAEGYELDQNYNGSYYGTLIDKHTEGVNHQHFFVYRLDMDVDGTENNVAEMNTMAVPAGKHNLYGNTMVTQMTALNTEKEAQRSINVASNRNWMIMNHAKTDQWGHHSSYMLMPGAGVKPFVLDGSSLMNRAGFLRNHVWVTPLDESEIYPAGNYPAGKQVSPGLPSWTANNRSIANQDVVLWYVAGVTHIVRPEEWPIMAPHYVKFSLMPFGFFSQNPTVKMPPLKAVPVSALTGSAAQLLAEIPVCNTPKLTKN